MESYKVYVEEKGMEGKVVDSYRLVVRRNLREGEAALKVEPYREGKLGNKTVFEIATAICDSLKNVEKEMGKGMVGYLIGGSKIGLYVEKGTEGRIDVKKLENAMEELVEVLGCKDAAYIEVEYRGERGGEKEFYISIGKF